MTSDIAARARGQAFGTKWADRPTDATVAEQLLEGVVHLPPHAPAPLPPSPTWAENLAGDANWEFQFHALAWLDVLRRVGERDGDQAKRAMYERYLRSWVASNPRDASPSRHAWADVAVAHRAITMVCAVAWLGAADWLVGTLHEHGEVLADDCNYRGHSNHALHQDTGLLTVADCLQRADWSALAVRRMAALFEASVDHQGVCNEGALEYQLGNYLWYLEAAARVAAAGLRVPEVFRRIALMPDLLAHGTLPDGSLEQLGDTSRRTAVRATGTIAEYAATRGRRGPRPRRLAAHFAAGYAFGRSSWAPRNREEGSFWSLRFGRCDGYHAHSDAGSVTFFAGGEQLVSDPGKYAYAADAYRSYVTGRAAHSVVEAVGRSYDRARECELVASYTNRSRDVVTIRDRGYDGVEILRTLVYPRHGSYLLVQDEVRSVGSVELIQRWQLAPGLAVGIDGASLAATGSGITLDIVWVEPQGFVLDAVTGARDPVQGWRSPGYGDLVPAFTASASTAGDRVRFLAVLAVRGVASSPVQVQSTEAEGRGVVTIVNAGHRDVVEFSAGYAVVRDG